MHRIVKDSSLATELNERQAREETHSRRRNAHGPPQHFEALEKQHSGNALLSTISARPIDTAQFCLRSGIKTSARPSAGEVTCWCRDLQTLSKSHM